MKVNFSINISGLENMQEDAIDKAREVLYLSMTKMEEIAKRKCPVDTGRLRNSITLYPFGRGANEYVLSDGVEYGEYVEYGTSPHFPPVEALKGWSRRVLGDEKKSFAVAKTISLRGTPAQPFFRPALMEVSTYWVPIFYRQVMAAT